MSITDTTEANPHFVQKNWIQPQFSVRKIMHPHLDRQLTFMLPQPLL